jgi:hypothetical protein
MTDLLVSSGLLNQKGGRYDHSTDREDRYDGPV